MPPGRASGGRTPTLGHGRARHIVDRPYFSRGMRGASVGASTAYAVDREQRWWPGSGQSVLGGVAGGGEARGEAGLAEDVGDVGADGAGGDRQARGDGAVGQVGGVE